MRAEIIAQRKQLAAAEVEAASRSVCSKIAALPVFQKAKTIGSYCPIHNEIDPSFLPKGNKQWYYPRCEDQHMQFHTITTPADWQSSPLGFLQPRATCASIAANALDVVLVPLVAFNARGYRLGWGKGLYDRCFDFLRAKPRLQRPYLIGLAYAWQARETFSPAKWDIRLNQVVISE